jgi:hypothetical protein
MRERERERERERVADFEDEYDSRMHKIGYVRKTGEFFF